MSEPAAPPSSPHPPRHRVVVTGIGLISPLGIGTDATWDGLMTARSGIGPVTQFDASDQVCRIAGEVDGFDPADFFPRKDIKKTDRFIQFAVAASEFALQDAKLPIDDDNRDRIGVVIGSGIGGLPTIEANLRALIDRGPSRVSPFFIPSQIVNMAAGQVSIRNGLRGLSTAPATACTTGLHAVGDAFRHIQFGLADAIVAGGTEAVLTPLSFAGFGRMKALSTRNDEPELASRPWDRDRDGFVMGEGAGILVLERRDLALARGARIYAEIVGYGMSSDAYHISAPDPDGDGAARVMQIALADAGLAPDAIAYVNAHGTSTPLGDLSEVRAVERVFGDHAQKLAISSTKSATGHLLGAAGGLESGILALALHHQILPATLNLDHVDEQANLDFVPKTPRPCSFDHALTNSFGFGGTNGALIMRRVA
ncbi:MAG: beta-ketoacyl-ACP synthase II [Acidobacteriota bacterium]